MNVFSQAKGIIKSKAHESRVFIELEKLLDEASSFETLITQAKGRKDQAEKEAKDAVANTEKLKQKAEKLVAKAKADAEAIVADAQAQAAQTIVEAQAKVDELKLKFETLQAAQDEMIEKKHQDMVWAVEEYEKAKNALIAKTDEVRVAEEKLAQVQAQLAQLKNTL